MEIKIADNCKVFAKNYDGKSIEQVRRLAEENVENTIRIMPDYHLGKGCVIGTTMDINNGKVNPSHVGVDIGCGMTSFIIEKDTVDLEHLDKIIRNKIPHGSSVRKTPACKFELLKKINSVLINEERILNSIGTLGGGNHFIEVGKSEKGYFLTVHSGSRNLGKQIAEYWQNKAYDNYRKEKDLYKDFIVRGEDKKSINSKLKELDTKFPNKDKNDTYLTGEDLNKYLSDCKIANEYAKLNRRVIIKTILKDLGIDYNEKSIVESIHNYISEDGFLRKGAIESRGKELLIPINMRDGIIYGIGKNNPEWNYSAPHGAGRIHSRSEAKKNISMEDFKESMKGIFTTCVNENTLDESPMAYKSIDDILSCIGETVTVLEIIKPIYNFKSN